METYLPLGSLIRILPLYCSSPEELYLRNGRGGEKSNPPQLAGKADRVQHIIRARAAAAASRRKFSSWTILVNYDFVFAPLDQGILLRVATTFITFLFPERKRRRRWKCSVVWNQSMVQFFEDSETGGKRIRGDGSQSDVEVRQ